MMPPNKPPGRRLEQLGARARHKIRIRVKKIDMRDFFETILPNGRKATRRMANALKQVQDGLGALNDFAAHRKLAADSALTGAQSNRRARAFVAHSIARGFAEVRRRSS
jgi:CHAD domain-containing protein